MSPALPPPILKSQPRKAVEFAKPPAFVALAFRSTKGAICTEAEAAPPPPAPPQLVALSDVSGLQDTWIPSGPFAAAGVETALKPPATANAAKPYKTLIMPLPTHRRPPPTPAKAG
jgi:hypothetical protein